RRRATPGPSLLGGLARRALAAVLHRLLQVLLEGLHLLVELREGVLLLPHLRFEAVPLLCGEGGGEQPLLHRRQAHLGIHLLLDLDGVIAGPVLELVAADPLVAVLVELRQEDVVGILGVVGLGRFAGAAAGGAGVLVAVLGRRDVVVRLG